MIKKTYRLIPALLVSAALMTSCASEPVKQAEEPQCTEYASDTLAKKPIIYLYGYDAVDVEITLTTDGTITTSYPAMNSDKTWKFMATKDGSMNFDGKKYRYIFWEGYLPMNYSFAKGFCVRGNEVVNFLDKQLDSFAFTPQEKQDFITYWAPQMAENEYNVISFQTANYTKAAKLTVIPKPDKTIRVFMAWYATDQYVNMTPQTFKAPTRSGKVLVEWGGSEMGADGSDAASVLSTDTHLTGGATQSAMTTTTDPYAQYGERAQCAKAWDSCGISNTMGKWATLTEQTRGEAYNHWLHYGTAGW